MANKHEKEMEKEISVTVIGLQNWYTMNSDYPLS